MVVINLELNKDGNYRVLNSPKGHYNMDMVEVVLKDFYIYRVFVSPGDDPVAQLMSASNAAYEHFKSLK